MATTTIKAIELPNGDIANITDKTSGYVATDATTSAHGLMSASDKTKLNGIASGAEVNQNAFSNVAIGASTISADSKTDTLTLVGGANITLTPDATNDKITILLDDTVDTGEVIATDIQAGNLIVNGTSRFLNTINGDISGNAATATSATSATKATQDGNGAVISTTYLKVAQKGVANGLAELDANGVVVSSQLPSFVDDVIEGYYYNNKFYKESTHTTQITGETGKIYVNLESGTDQNKTYRWSGSAFVVISETLALGETSSTAYRGDRGKTAYDHATDSSRLTTATASGLYKVASTAQGHIASLTAVTKADITGLGIPGADTNTTYTLGTSGNTVTLTPSSGNAQSITVPYATSAGSATSATTASKLGSSNVGSATNPIYLASGTATACTYSLNKTVPSDAVFTDTKNTAGSTDTSSKIFLIGATSQAANPQTYSDNEVYTTSGVLTTKSVQVGGGSATMQYSATTKSINFVFAS